MRSDRYGYGDRYACLSIGTSTRTHTYRRNHASGAPGWNFKCSCLPSYRVLPYKTCVRVADTNMFVSAEQNLSVRVCLLCSCLPACFISPYDHQIMMVADTNMFVSACCARVCLVCSCLPACLLYFALRPPIYDGGRYEHVSVCLIRICRTTSHNFLSTFRRSCVVAADLTCVAAELSI